MMSIGRFARRCGLSISALRHYAEVGLPCPLESTRPPDTGYRYYAEEQLPAARRIAPPRYLDAPLAVIREVRDLPADALRARLAGYRAEVESALWRLRRSRPRRHRDPGHHRTGGRHARTRVH